MEGLQFPKVAREVLEQLKRNELWVGFASLSVYPEGNAIIVCLQGVGEESYRVVKSSFSNQRGASGVP